MEKGVKLIYGLHNFGNTLLCLENKIGGFFGMENKAFVGVANHVNAISQLTIKVPSQEDISTYNNIDEPFSLARKKPTNVLNTCNAVFPIPLLKTAIIVNESVG